MLKPERRYLWSQWRRLHRLEKKRLLSSWTVRAALLFLLILPLAGLLWYQPATDLTAASLAIANPHLAAGLGGAVVWMVLTLLELQRMQKQQMESLTNAAVSPVLLQTVKTAALLRTALGAGALLLLVWLPWTVMQMQPFSLVLYLLSGLILLLPCWILGILLAAGCYQLTQRLEISLLLCTAAIGFSLSTWVSPQYALRWLNPLVPVMSDYFSNRPALVLAVYSRVCWFLLLGGFWLLTLLTVRCYQLGPLQSFHCHCQTRRTVPLAAALLLSLGLVGIVQEPYVDNSPLEPVFAEAEAPEAVYLQHSELEVELDGVLGRLQGKAVYTLHNRGTEETLCSFQINPGYTIQSMTRNGQPWEFIDLHDDTDNDKTVQFLLPAGENQKLTVQYGGSPKIWSILRDTLMGMDISGQYVELSNSKLGPRFYLQRTEDDETVFRFTLPAQLTPVTNSPHLTLLREKGGKKQWQSVSQDARINLYAADYTMEPIEEAGMHIHFYYSSQQQQMMEQLDALEQIGYAFRYCAQRYGALPFDAVNPLQLVEESAYAMGGGAFGNFSVMGETIFSPQNLSNVDLGASGAEVLAHEIVHQWWGLSWMFWEDGGPWSSEGLTCYTTYRMMKAQYGQAYARQHYVEQWKVQVQQLQRSYYYRHPEILSQLPEAYQAAIRAQQESAQRYAVMPLLLLQADQALGGEAQMDAVLAKLFANGGAEVPGYLSWQDFLAVSGLTEEDFDLEQAVLL